MNNTAQRCIQLAIFTVSLLVLTEGFSQPFVDTYSFYPKETTEHQPTSCGHSTHICTGQHSSMLPVPDEWSAITNTSEHIKRHENSFVQAGDKFYIFGGRESPQTVEQYDYNTNSWTEYSTAPIPFNHFQAVEFQGLIWVIGAFKNNSFPNETPADNIYIFDPVKNEWITGPEVPNDRKRGSAALVVHDDKFYIACGNTLGHNGGYVNWFDEYDPCAGTWTPLDNAPQARDHFHAAVDGDQLYLVSGRRSGGPGGVFAPLVSEVEVYDFDTESWSTLPDADDLPTPRAAAGIAVFEDQLFVIGGEGNGQAYATTEAFDLDTQNWSTKASLNQGRHGTQIIVSGDGIWITSGSPNQGGGNLNGMEVYGTDNPTGTPLVSSEILAPESIGFSDGSTADITIANVNGNQGIFITSIELNGQDAADFEIGTGTFDNILLKDDAFLSIPVTYNGNESNPSATLTINYGAEDQATIQLTGLAASAASMSITVEFQGRPNANQDVDIQFFDPTDNQNPVFSFSTTTDANGLATINGLTSGIYDIAVKHPQFLQRVIQTSPLSAGTNNNSLLTSENNELRAGDADNNNQVSALDFSIFVGAFNTQPSDSNYDSRADFDGNLFVNALDFSLLVTNFNTSGEEAIPDNTDKQAIIEQQ